MQLHCRACAITLFEPNGKIIRKKELQDKTSNRALRRPGMSKTIERTNKFLISSYKE
ncbi:hypothetical protein DPMN_037616 [Dreissena polymorpha]|uniref:Uncharacterized protein n=1 Tax=Dreissena polymorpha TaxID=45954 RepID=A0A9D4MEV1_DREPO|nr:hypothetical protein DPMN_037616 [Dreissena polymorpha]